MDILIRNFGHVCPEDKFPCVDVRDSSEVWIWLNKTTWIDMSRDVYEAIREGFEHADKTENQERR